jgi:hypothetical protein
VLVIFIHVSTGKEEEEEEEEEETITDGEM